MKRSADLILIVIPLLSLFICAVVATSCRPSPSQSRESIIAATEEYLEREGVNLSDYELMSARFDEKQKIWIVGYDIISSPREANFGNAKVFYVTDEPSPTFERILSR